MRNARIVQAAVCLFVAGAGVVKAAQPLPYYDIRLDNDGLPQRFVTDALQNARANGGQVKVDAARAALQNQFPEASINPHEFFGTPHWIASTSRWLTPPAKDPKTTPREVARGFIADHATLFEIDAAELDKAVATRDFQTAHNGVTHLTLQQQVAGIDLYGCEVLANVTRAGELINISSSMLPRPAGDFTIPQATITALDAFRAAAANVGIVMNSDPTPLAAPVGANQQQTWRNTPDFRSDEPMTSSLIYFPLTRLDVRPAWSVLIPEKGIGNTYEMMIDATNGQVLRRWNRLHFNTTEPASYRVYTSDSPAPMSPGTATPTGGQAPYVPQTLVTVNPVDISAISQNGWIPDGSNETLGNNCDAHLDLDSNNSPDLPRPAGSPYRVFDVTHDPAQAPTTATNRSAAVIQLFYLTNQYHDKLYSLGFNEAAKNFQTTNFGLGGTGNDAVQADAQDGSGTNNANFGTSGGDGTTGRMQMYVFTGPTPDRDGDLDADIVFHELSHGLSIRLSNGTVSGTQSGGMGEGWGDYFGLSLNSQPGDDPHAVYATGAHTTYQLWGAAYTSNYYYGIRRYPYTTDMTKNPMTYKFTDTAQLVYPPAVPRNTNITGAANEVHNVGEVWCTALWEARANLVDAHGFAGNDLMMQLVVDGLKLQPSNPNFLEARAAILQADLVDNAGANAAPLWLAFGKRGMGPLATSPSGSTSSGVVESFLLHTFAFPLGQPTILQPGVTTPFQFQVAGVAPGIVPDSDSAILFLSVNGGAFVQTPLVESSTNIYDVILPPLNCFDTIRYYFTVNVNGVATVVPTGAPTQTYLASVYQSTATVFSDNFETDLGWTVTNSATTGAWVRVDPIGTSNGGVAAQPEDDNSSVGTLCYVTGQGVAGGAVGAQDVDGGPTILTSPLIDLSAPGGYSFSYARWFYTSGSPRTFTVEISNNNGTSWVPVETVSTSTSAWVTKSWSVSNFVTPTSQVRVRFTTSDNPNTYIVEGGVDDVVFSMQICTPPVPCLHGDINGDTSVDGRDIQRFTDVLINGGATAPEICAGDLEATPDSQIDLGDVDNFVTCLLAGGC